MGNRIVILMLFMLLGTTSALGCMALQPLTPPVDGDVSGNDIGDDLPIAATPTVLVETHANADWTNVQSRSEDGLAMLGNPDAPVTFIDYSDFL